MASDSSGNFVVVWRSQTQDGSATASSASATPAPARPSVPSSASTRYTTSSQGVPAVASDSSGNFVVVWESYDQDGSSCGVFGQRYASTGAPLGPEFRVNTYTTGYQGDPAVASDSSGNFVVVWRATTRTARSCGVFGQRYASTGAPLGPEFRVNTYTTDVQSLPAVASDSSGNFVVVWRAATRTARATASSASATPAPARPSVPSSASTRTRRIARSIRPWPRTPPATSSSSGRATTRTARASASSASATPAPARPSVPSSASTRTRRISRTFRPWPRTPPATSSSSGRAARRTATSYGVFGQRYASTGAPLGPEFRVNTYTTMTRSFRPWPRTPPATSSSSGELGVTGRGVVGRGRRPDHRDYTGQTQTASGLYAWWPLRGPCGLKRLDGFGGIADLPVDGRLRTLHAEVPSIHGQ